MYNSPNIFGLMKTKSAESKIFHVFWIIKIDVQTMRRIRKKEKWYKGFGNLCYEICKKLCNISTKSLYVIYSGWSIDSWIIYKQFLFYWLCRNIGSYSVVWIYSRFLSLCTIFVFVKLDRDNNYREITGNWMMKY